MTSRPRVWALAAAVAALPLSACELQEVTVTEFADLVVAEVYVTVGPTPTANRVRAFLHGAAGGAEASTETFDDATVTVTRDDGLSLGLALGQPEECVDSQPEGATGSCFTGDATAVQGLQPGDRLRLEVALADGRRLSGATRVPGVFELSGVGSSCRLPPDTVLPLAWSPSEGAWAYVNETSINGLPDALAPEGIVVEDDPLFLLGLSISATDTTVVFPSEFGVFERFDLDRDVAVRLQRGLPDRTSAAVSIAAADRNFVNWVRGGNFNPSGAVRVSSLRGDGAGVFGAIVLRELVIVSSAAGGGAPDCPLP